MYVTDSCIENCDVVTSRLRYLFTDELMVVMYTISNLVIIILEFI